MAVRVFMLFICICFFQASSLLAASFSVSPENTEIGFELGSTWHTVYGKAHDFSGRIIVDDFKKPSVISGLVAVNVRSIDTGNERRNRKMADFSLEAGKYPEIRFRILGAEQEKLYGRLTIRNITKDVTFEMSRKNSASNGRQVFEYNAATIISWRDYGVRDPSIFIARIHENMKIYVKLFAPEQ